MTYSLLVFTPIFSSALLYFALQRAQYLIKYIALALFTLMLVVSLNLLNHLPQSGYLFLGELLSVPRFNFTLMLQVDTLSVIMLILSSLILILVTLSSWSVKKEGAYFSLLIMFSGAIFGVFASTNLIWFFIFWELTLAPMYFLVGIWGAERRVYAAVKFFLYTHVASMLILLAFFLLIKESGQFDMSMIDESTLTSASLIWWLLFIGFAVKMPIFPFHTWLPDAHVQAPAPISVLLAGVLLKMGAYAMIKFVILLLPQSAQQYAIYMLVLGLVSLFFSAFLAIYQTHIKKIVAYSSISHMGLIVIAISTLSFSGLSAAVYEMIGHAFIISPLFLIAGFLHHKTGSWQMKDLGGLMQKAPYLSAIFVLSGLAALGLPATMGFIGEITILISAINANGAWIAGIALASMLSAVYIIWTFRRVIYGTLNPSIANIDFKMHKVEFSSLLVFATLLVLFGIYPQPIFDVANQAFAHLGGVK